MIPPGLPALLPTLPCLVNFTPYALYFSP
nr:hypothetical protein SYMBAF_220006 [Serratia symbiotica]